MKFLRGRVVQVGPGTRCGSSDPIRDWGCAASTPILADNLPTTRFASILPLPSLLLERHRQVFIIPCYSFVTSRPQLEGSSESLYDSYARVRDSLARQQESYTKYVIARVSSMRL